MRIDLVTLDGDQARAGIRRTDADFDILARGHILVLQRELQFGIAVQRTGDITGTRHAEFDAVLFHTFGIADAVEKRSGIGGIEREIESAGRNYQRAFLHRDFLGPRFVFVGAVGLLQQHRHKASLDKFQLQLIDRDFLRLRIDGDQVDAAFRAARHISHVAIGLEADEVRQFRHQHRRIGRHAAPALGLEGAGEEMQPVGGAGIFVEPQFEFGVAFFVGDAFVQLVRVAFLGAQRIIEAMIGIAAEGRVGGLQGQCRFDAAIGGRGTEQVLHVDLGLQLIWRYPAIGDFAGQPRHHFHAVRQELLHPHRHAAELGISLPVLHGEQADGVVAGRRGFLRGVRKFIEATRAELDLFAFHRQAARIGNVDFQRNPGHRFRPTGGFHDHADVDGIARPVDAAIGKQVRRQRARLQRIAHAADIEAREIQPAVAAIQRQETHVAGLLNQVHQRRAFARQVFQFGKLAAAGGIGGLRE